MRSMVPCTSWPAAGPPSPPSPGSQSCQRLASSAHPEFHGWALHARPMLRRQCRRSSRNPRTNSAAKSEVRIYLGIWFHGFGAEDPLLRRAARWGYPVHEILVLRQDAGGVGRQDADCRQHVAADSRLAAARQDHGATRQSAGWDAAGADREPHYEYCRYCVCLRCQIDAVSKYEAMMIFCIPVSCMCALHGQAAVPVPAMCINHLLIIQ